LLIATAVFVGLATPLTNTLNPEIAEVERHLASIGQYDFFKSEYQKRFNKSWEKGRESILLKIYITNCIAI
jgi:hypothetical protein